MTSGKSRTLLLAAAYVATVGALYWAIERRGHALYESRLLAIYHANLGSAALSCERYLQSADSGLPDPVAAGKAVGRLQFSQGLATQLGYQEESRSVARLKQQLDASEALVRKYQKLLSERRGPEAEAVYRQRVLPLVHKNLADSLRERLREQSDRREAVMTRVHWWAAATSYLVLACAVLTFVLFTLWADRLARYAAGDAERLRLAMKGIAAGDFRIRIERRGDRDADRLAGDLERMAAELEDTQFKLLRSERESAFGRLAGGAAHALNSPIGVIIGYAELLLRRGDLDPRDLDVIQAVRDQARRADAIVKNLRPFAGAAALPHRPVSVNGILLGLEETLQTALEAERCALVLALEEGVPTVAGSERDLRHALHNLLSNAIRATRGVAGGKATVRTRREAGWVSIVVEDNGEGIPAENLRRIFDAFFTTRPPQEGVGLGLSTAMHIVRDHGGELSAESGGPGQGSRFLLRLPVWEAAPGRSPVAPLARAGRILVVDDEPGFRDIVSRALGREGLDVDTASGVEEAVAKAARRPYDLIVADYHLGLRSGLELFSELQEGRPDLARRFVFTSGESAAGELQAKAAGLDIPLLLKPYDLEELVLLVRHRLDAVGVKPPTA